VRFRDAVTELLASEMGHLSITRRRQARTIITGTISEAVKAGKLTRHSLAGIELKDNGRAADRADFVFPAYEQVARLAATAGVAVWLMRGCGLRIQEAIGVRREDFTTPSNLRLDGQAARDGRTRLPLKHRKRGEYRDVIVPAWLWAIVKDLPPGPLCPGSVTPYAQYETVRAQLQRAARAAGIPAGFRPHSLRHAFASALLSRGVPITDVARWLGHKDIRETYAMYSHFMPEAEDRALGVLASEYAEWSG
jgi:integrase